MGKIDDLVQRLDEVTRDEESEVITCREALIPGAAPVQILTLFAQRTRNLNITVISNEMISSFLQVG